MSKMLEIEEVIDKLEVLVKALREDRDRAWEEVSRLKKALDDRELELLQLDEEMQRDAKRFEEERTTMQKEREDTENRLDVVASRIKALLPLLPDHDIEQENDGSDASRPGDGQA